MRSVPFKSVLHWVAGKMLGDPDRMRDAEAADFTRYINQYVRKGWERDNWPEWTVAEERRYRSAYSAETTYAIGDEVWNETAQEYQRCTALEPINYLLLGTTSGAFGHTAFLFYDSDPAAGVPVVGGYLRKAGAATGSIITQVQDSGGYLIYVSPDIDDLNVPGDAELSLTLGPVWETITDLHRYISLDQAGETPIGTVIRMSPLNPEEHPGTSRYKFTLSSHGVQVPARAGDSVWLQFRLRPPTFTNAKFNSATIYTEGQLVYWLVTGECYERTAVPDPEAEVPHSALPSATAQWTLVPFPYVLAEYVQRAAYAEALDSDGQPDKSARQADLAEDELALEWSKSEGQQDQTRPYSVGVRPGTTRRCRHSC